MSSSKGTTSQASNVTDRRIGATDQAIVVAEGSTFTPNVQTQSSESFYYQDTSVEALQAAAEIATRAIDSNTQVTGRALDSNVDVTQGAFNLVGYVTEDALAYYDRVNARTLANVEVANEALRDVSQQAIEKVLSATRSDAAEAFNNLIKYAALGAITLAAAITFKKGR